MQALIQLNVSYFEFNSEVKWNDSNSLRINELDATHNSIIRELYETTHCLALVVFNCQITTTQCVVSQWYANRKGEMMQLRSEDLRYRCHSLTNKTLELHKIQNFPLEHVRFKTIPRPSAEFFDDPVTGHKLKEAKNIARNKHLISTNFSATFSPLIVRFAFELYLMSICLLR